MEETGRAGVEKGDVTDGRRCPRDGHPLKVELVSGIPVDVCHECDGVWLDPGEILELAPEVRTEELAVPPRSALVPHAALPCPACRKGSLIPHYYGERAQRVEVGVCDRCDGLWLDAGLMRQIGGRRGQPPEERVTRHQEIVPKKQRVGDGVSFPRHPREWFVVLTGMPLEVGNPCRIVPWVTLFLVFACLGVFVAQAVREPPGELIEAWGLVPTKLEGGEYFRLLTALFLHVNLAHLIGNLFFLYTFGDNLEERYGSVRYVALYLVSGVSGGLLSAALGPPAGENVARVGASGAISGLLGAYLVTFPGTRIIMAIPFFRFIPVVIRWRVWAFLLVWIALNAAGLLFQREGVYGVDYLAHLGGFSAGVLGGGLLSLDRQARLVRA